jgi:hypothetical protein
VKKITSVHKPTVYKPTLRKPSAIVNEQDIANIEESSPPPYELIEQNDMANELVLEPINPTIEKLPDISYNPEEDLSYRE